MKKKLIVAFLALAMLLTVFGPMQAKANAPEWRKIGGYWYYYVTETNFYSDYIPEIDGEYYFFYPDGKMGTGWCKQEYDYGGTHYEYWYYANGSGVLQSGWQNIGGVWYYFDRNYHCVMSCGRLQKIDGKTYAFSDSGAMQTGWIKRTGKNSDGSTWVAWLYADSSGALVTGWQKIGGVWYYFDSGFYMYSNGIREIDGKNYYFYPSGAMLIGWVQNNSTDGYGRQYSYWYYADSSGVLQSGWKWINGAWYYFSTSGVPFMYTGSCWIDGSYYVLQNSGALATGGWVKYVSWDGSVQWFYTNADGTPTIGWKKIGGVWYYFYTNGVMARNTIEWIDGERHAFGDSGAWIHTPGWNKLYNKQGYPSWVYLEADGTVVTGWKTINGVKYYFNPMDLGFMVTGGRVIDGYLNLFDSSGAWTGLQKNKGWYKFNSDWFYVKSDGTAALEWNTIDGVTYYFSPQEGKMYYGGIQYINSVPYYFYDSGALGTYWIDACYGRTYYANASGKLLTEWQTIGGKKYYFNPYNFEMYHGGVYVIGGTQYYFKDDGVCAAG